MVLATRFDLRLPGARSLKEKRSRIRPVVERIRHRHHLSVAEVDGQDEWGRAVIEVAVVAESPGHAARVMDGIERLVYSSDGVEVIQSERFWAETD